MRWIDFISIDPETRSAVQVEFEWMRRYAFAYFRTFVSNPAEAEDFAQDVLELFIGRLKERGDLNRSFFMHMVRYSFLDRMRAYRRDVLKHRAGPPRRGDGTDSEEGSILDTLAAYDGRLPQEMAMESQSIRNTFDAVLGSFKPHQQTVILQRLIGLPAREIQQVLHAQGIDMTPNHVNVLFHKFKTLVRTSCWPLEHQTE